MPPTFQDLPEELRTEFLWEPFVHGSCYIFALAMHRLTGWQIVVLDTSDEPGGHPLCHAAVRDTSGNIWDARGIHRPEEILGFAEPFTKTPQPTVRDVSSGELLCQGNVSEMGISVAEYAVAQFFPALSLGVSPRRQRALEFAGALEELSRRYGWWIFVSGSLHTWPVLANDVGDECGYMLARGQSGWLIERALRPIQPRGRRPRSLEVFLSRMAGLSRQHGFWIRATIPAALHWPRVRRGTGAEHGYTIAAASEHHFAINLTAPR